MFLKQSFFKTKCLTGDQLSEGRTEPFMDNLVGAWCQYLRPPAWETG